MEISETNIHIALNLCKVVLIIIVFILLGFAYTISFHINSTLLINKKCGDDVIEMNTLRNKSMHVKKIHFMSFIIIILIIILVLFAIIILYNKRETVIQDVIIYIVIAIIVLINIFVNGRPYNFLKNDFKDYSNRFEAIVCEIIDVFSELKGIKFDGSLRTIFPPNVLDELVSRWKGFQIQNHREFNIHTEMIYTDNAFIDELDKLLQNIKYSCHVISEMRKDKDKDIDEATIKNIADSDKSVRLFVSLLSPEKRELTFIHDAYKKWTKKNHNHLRKYRKDFSQLPRLSDDSEKNALIKSRSDWFLYLSWIIIGIIIGYSSIGHYNEYLQELSIAIIITLFISIIVYVLMFRS